METILVVDDDDLVLELAVKILTAAKFRVLSASSGRSALQVASTIDGNIDLLLADVELPGMTGPELAETLTESRPNIRVILMSGVADSNRLSSGWAFINKPFFPKELVEMVISVLRTPDKPQGGQP
jgi:two-component system cell cycle sensor histidine kinase/response regulator CckA